MTDLRDWIFVYVAGNGHFPSVCFAYLGDVAKPVSVRVHGDESTKVRDGGDLTISRKMMAITHARQQV